MQLTHVAALLACSNALQPLDRRAVAKGFAAITTTALIPATPATAAVATALKTVSWSATDGFDSDFPSQINFIEFDEKAYKAMRDDPRRTPKFAKAIRSRLAELGPEAVVLDLGTGPFCVLALIAATAGAKKVYAVEANPEAYRRAKNFIAQCEDPTSNRRDVNGLVPLKPGAIEVIQGFSTELTLPEKVDLCVFEICGSLASEEGLYATMKDARERHVKRPDEPGSYIPRRCQTYAAPVAYALHNLLTPPSFDWSKIVGKDPIRFNCRDEALQVLSPPQLLEDVDFSQPLPSLPAAVRTSLSFPVTAAAIVNAQKGFEKAFAEEKQMQSLLIDAREDWTGKTKIDAAQTAAQIGSKFSGLAMWPALVCDGSDGTLIRSRGPNGEAQKSHWQTVLQLMTDEPLAVAAGDAVIFEFEAAPQAQVTKATTYKLAGGVARGSKYP